MASVKKEAQWEEHEEKRHIMNGYSKHTHINDSNEKAKEESHSLLVPPLKSSFKLGMRRIGERRRNGRIKKVTSLV